MAKKLTKAFRGKTSPVADLAATLKNKHFSQSYAVIIVGTLLSKAIDEIKDKTGVDINYDPVPGYGILGKSGKPRPLNLSEERVAVEGMNALRKITKKFIEIFGSAGEEIQLRLLNAIETVQKADLFIKDLDQRAERAATFSSGVKAIYYPKPALALHVAAELVHYVGESYKSRTGHSRSTNQNYRAFSNHNDYYQDVAKRFPFDRGNVATLQAADARRELTALDAAITGLRLESAPAGLPRENILSEEERVISYVLKHYIRPYRYETGAAIENPAGMPATGEVKKLVPRTPKALDASAFIST